MDFDPKHLIQEIEYNVSKRDKIKAGIVLSYFFDLDKEYRAQVLRILATGDPSFSLPYFLEFLQKEPNLIEDSDFETAFLEVIFADPHLFGDMLTSGAEPRTLLIKFAGETKLPDFVPYLTEILTSTNEEDILEATILALGQIGDPQATTPVSEFLYSNNRTLMLAAIKALGQIGSPTAIKRLSEKMGQDPNIDLLILDIFGKIQDSLSLTKLNETLSSHYAHLRNYAKNKLVKIGSKVVPFLIENLNYDDPDLLIHTLNVLGEIGDPAAVMPIRKLLNSHPQNSNVRFAAYEALGMLPIDKGAYTLAAGLMDEDEQVRVAAASAIEKNLNPVLVAGIRNMVKEKNKETFNLVKAVITAQAKDLFLNLLAEDSFKEVALDYLKTKTPEDVRNFYFELLRKYGYAELIDKPKSKKKEPKKKIAVAVDDSKMILSLYKSNLFELGFEPVLFANPKEAVEWLKKNKPVIVFTDLNMPQMTGIQLTAETRKIYSKKQLPIIMVTTQNEATDNEAALEAGVSDILYKPFTKESLEEKVKEYIG
ncbi:HEAT repeat-containing protein [Desulfonauticus submarinus]|uniref:HEAT repeat-containing protein n=1 Tax=Desulfonauticus submarinus TaxID=206665 RepID=A0A1H0F2A1_9BACT|nr:response regulator [Desulfonauticus submarinus]SDN88731.1 HEAT repeat-containing protein [Desulfonauticus submarinus]